MRTVGDHPAQRRPVRRAGMVGATLHPTGWSTRRATVRQGPQPSWIEELEGLRNALTDEEFETVKRHLLAG